MTGRLLAIGSLLVASLSPASRQQPPTFRSTATGVVVNVFVTAGKAPVDGLTSRDFEVLDNGVRQTADAAPVEGAPIDLALVFDGSGDATRYVDQFKAAVRQAATHLRPTDRVQVLVCDTGVREVVPMQPASDPMPLDSLVKPNAPYGTTVRHGMLEAMARVREPDRRQVIVTLVATLGGDVVLSYPALMPIARVTDAILYVGVLPEFGAYVPGYFHDLGEAAATTGGEMLFVADPTRAEDPIGGFRSAFGGRLPDVAGATVESFTDVVQALKQVLDNVRRGYVLNYSPQGVAHPGWHDVTVHVTKSGGQKYVVRARKGYVGG